MAHKVVTKLSSGLEYLDHCITMDNYLSSILLFIELVSKGIYAINTMTTNYIGLPSHLKNIRAFKLVEKGHMEWAMHEDQVISYIM